MCIYLSIYYKKKEEKKQVFYVYEKLIIGGGVDADVYNVLMSGHGFGFAVNSGRIAGGKCSSGIAFWEIIKMEATGLEPVASRV